MGRSVRPSSRCGVAGWVIVAVSLVVALPACTGGDDDVGTTPPSSVREPGPVSTESSGPVAIRLEVPSSTVRAGATVPVVVTVTNTTGKDLDLVQCGGPFQVWLGNRTVRPEPVFPLCAQPLRVPTGVSTYDVTMRASYPSCSSDRPVPADAVACDPGPAIPPLPPGTYEARLYQGPNVGPLPPPLPIRVTA